MGVLTTGFNAPGVDLIAMLRPTKSTGLYVQMAGRGTRLAPGQGRLPGARLRRQRRPARADRRGEAEAARQPARATRRSRSARTARASSRPPSGSAPTAATPSRRRRSRSSAEASTLAILTTGKPQWLARRWRQLPRPREARRPHHAAGRLPVRARPPPRMGLLRAHRLRPAEGRRLVAPARAAACRCRAPSPRRSPGRARSPPRPRSPCGRAAASPRSSA